MERIKVYVDGSAINNENPNVPTLGGVAIFFVKYPGIVDRNEPVGFYERIVDHKLNGVYLRKHSEKEWNELKTENKYGPSLDLEKTTNNTAELAAIWMVNAVLEEIQYKMKPLRPKPDFELPKFEIVGDSMYAGNLIFGDWKPKHNKNLVKRIKKDLAKSNFDITWKYVKAHDTDENNNYVDYLARSAAYGVETPSGFDQWKKEQI